MKLTVYLKFNTFIILIINILHFLTTIIVIVFKESGLKQVMIGNEILYKERGTLLLYFHDDLVRASYYHMMKEVYI